MLKSFIAALSFATATSIAFASDLPRTPEETAKAFEKHFNSANVDALLALYAPGAVFVPAAGVQLTNILNTQTKTIMILDGTGLEAGRSWFVNDRRVALVLKGQF